MRADVEYRLGHSSYWQKDARVGGRYKISLTNFTTGHSHANCWRSWSKQTSKIEPLSPGEKTA